MNKRKIQKLTTQCVNDVIGRIRSAEELSAIDRHLALKMVVTRFRFIELEAERKQAISK